MARAWHSHFGEYKLGGPDDQSAYDEWYKMTAGRFQTTGTHPLADHPKYIQDVIQSGTNLGSGAMTASVYSSQIMLYNQ